MQVLRTILPLGALSFRARLSSGLELHHLHRAQRQKLPSLNERELTLGTHCASIALKYNVVLAFLAYVLDPLWRHPPRAEDMPLPRAVVGVVDNDPGMLRAVTRLLTANGFRVQPYVSAEAFLQVMTNNEVACLVVDIHLDGMSGIDLRRRLAALRRAPPVIFMTAFDNPVTHQEATEAGCVAYLQKPFPSSQLIEALAIAKAATQSADPRASEPEPLPR